MNEGTKLEIGSDESEAPQLKITRTAKGGMRLSLSMDLSKHQVVVLANSMLLGVGLKGVFELETEADGG